MSDRPAAELLSFLVADIRGYTAFTHSRGDEAAARLAARFASIAREGIEAHDGRLIELRGDEALAVFASARASLRAAVALQEVFGDETLLEPSVPLAVGIGLDAGEVVPVEGGYRGGAINLAARLCSLAKAGESLASEGVCHLARAVEGVAIAEWGSAQVKGLTEPVRAFTLSAAPSLGPFEPARPQPLPEPLDSAVPMIGRDTELRRLAWGWQMARRGRGTIAVIRGQSGIGKSRLLSALAEVAVAGGGEVSHISLAAPGPARDVLTKGLLREDVPILLAVDDAEEHHEILAEAMAEAGSLDGRPVMLVLAVDEDRAPSETSRALRHLGSAHDVLLAPLDTDSSRRVAALYLVESVGDLPPGLLDSTGGIPRRLHETVAAWAERQATRRLGALASQAAGTRGETAVTESELAGTVVELQAIRDRVRRYGLGPDQDAPAPERPPYKGLDSFGPEDVESFFGRERLVADLVARVAGGGLLVVVGPSGSGKSSLVRAGLIPAIGAGVLPGSEDWTTVVVRPGEHPVRALDVALLPELPPDVRTRLTGDKPLLEQLAGLVECPEVLVVVDQAEELFTVCADQDERTAFVLGLLAAVADPGQRVRPVLTVRADYYGRFAAGPRLAAALSSNQLLVGPMTAGEYRRAISEPARRYGVTIEPALVDTLVDEVTGQGGALPLLSTSLLEQWEARTERTMSLETYRTMGGVRAAVGRLAESVYADLDTGQKLLARRVFLRLTGPGVGDTVVRRRVRLEDVTGDPATVILIDVLAARRLLTVSEGTVEVAHEALLREWPRFVGWLEEDREGIRLRAHLADAAQSWAEGGRDEGELYRGARLSAALEWTAQDHPDLSTVEQEFVAASTDEAQRSSTRQRRQNRRLRGLLVGVAVLLVLAMMAGGVALEQRGQASRQRNDAQRSAARAVTEETGAVARGAGADAQNTDDIPTALLNAVAAVRLAPSAATLGQLERVMGRHPELTHTAFMPHGPVDWLTTSPDGSTVAAGDALGEVALFDAHTLERTAITQVGRSRATNGAARMAFSPDGTTLAVAATPPNSPPVLMLDARRLTPLSQQLGGWPGRDVQVDGIDYSQDGRRVAVSVEFAAHGGETRRSIVMVWDLASPSTPVFRVELPDAQGVQISPDGKTVYVAAPFRSFDVASGRSLVENHDVGSFIYFDLNRSGTRMATLPYGANDDGQAINLIDTRTGKIVGTAPGASGGETFQMVTWAGNGLRTAASTFDGKIVVWYHGQDLERTILNGDGATVGLAFSPDATTLYSAGANGEIQSWDMEGYQSFVRRLPTQGPHVNQWVGQLSPDGRTLAYESDCLNDDCDHVHVTLLRLDRPVHDPPIELPGEGDFGASGWSPDSTRFVTGSHDGLLELVDVPSNTLLRTQHYQYGMVTESKFTADGRSIVVSFQSGAVLVVDAETLAPLRAPTRFSEPVLDVNTSPRGRTAFVLLGGPPTEFYAASAAHDWALLDTDTGVVLRRGTLDISNAIYSALSPDGVHAVVVGDPAQVVVLDTRTGAVTMGPTPPQQGRGVWVAYNLEGSRYFVGTSDRSVRVYDAVTGAQPGYLPGFGIYGGFDPDGSIVVANSSGEVYRWSPEQDAALAFACQQAGRDMTRAEWHQTFGDRPVVHPCPAA